jgi:nucleotide-binding universal stress UspA family protein
MLPLSKVVLPVDFSERTPGAARYARVLAEHFGAEVVVLHVAVPPPYEFGTLEGGGAVLGELMASRSVFIEKQLASLADEELKNVRVERVRLEGDAASRIVEYAHSSGAGLIVMPTHGYGPFRRFILGSVTAKVLHDADCPVWTGIHMEQVSSLDAIAFRSVVCALDLGPQSSKALSWAMQLAASFDARLTLCHAIPCVGVPIVEEIGPEFRAQVVSMAKERIGKLQSEAGTQAEVRIDGGDAPEVVAKICEDAKADVLVIARGSAAGVFGRLRTNAYAIIRQSPCPVVSV